MSAPSCRWCRKARSPSATISPLIAGVATGTEVDPTTYKYTIRHGVTFGDGSPLTPDDIVATIKFHMNPDSGSQLAAFFAPSPRSRRRGADEVTVKLKAPNVQFHYTPAHMAGFIFKKSQLEEHPEDIGSPDVLPLGTGPYRLVEFVPAERVVLEARDDYWGPKPVVKRINFVAIPDRQTRLLAMQNGDIDGTFDLAISDIDQWKALGNVDVITAPSLGVFMLTLDQSAPPFDDIHVRRAIAHSVDRDGLVQALLKGNGEAGDRAQSARDVGRRPPRRRGAELLCDAAGYEFDLEKAKAELAQSAHAGGLEISVPAPTADPYMVNIMQSVAENLKQIGITMPTCRRSTPTSGSPATSGMRISACRSWPTIPTSPMPANYPYPVLRQRERGEGRHERLELQERRRRQEPRRRQRAVRSQGPGGGAQGGLQDRQ